MIESSPPTDPHNKLQLPSPIAVRVDDLLSVGAFDGTKRSSIVFLSENLGRDAFPTRDDNTWQVDLGSRTADALLKKISERKLTSLNEAFLLRTISSDLLKTLVSESRLENLRNVFECLEFVSRLLEKTTNENLVNPSDYDFYHICDSLESVAKIIESLEIQNFSFDYFHKCDIEEARTVLLKNQVCFAAINTSNLLLRSLEIGSIENLNADFLFKLDGISRLALHVLDELLNYKGLEGSETVNSVFQLAEFLNLAEASKLARKFLRTNLFDDNLELLAIPTQDAEVRDTQIKVGRALICIAKSIPQTQSIRREEVIKKFQNYCDRLWCGVPEVIYASSLLSPETATKAILNWFYVVNENGLNSLMDKRRIFKNLALSLASPGVIEKLCSVFKTKGNNRYKEKDLHKFLCQIAGRWGSYIQMKYGVHLLGSLYKSLEIQAPPIKDEKNDLKTLFSTNVTAATKKVITILSDQRSKGFRHISDFVSDFVRSFLPKPDLIRKIELGELPPTEANKFVFRMCELISNIAEAKYSNFSEKKDPRVFITQIEFIKKFFEQSEIQTIVKKKEDQFARYFGFLAKIICERLENLVSSHTEDLDYANILSVELLADLVSKSNLNSLFPDSDLDDIELSFEESFLKSAISAANSVLEKAKFIYRRYNSPNFKTVSAAFDLLENIAFLKKQEFEFAAVPMMSQAFQIAGRLSTNYFSASDALRKTDNFVQKKLFVKRALKTLVAFQAQYASFVSERENKTVDEVNKQFQKSFESVSIKDANSEFLESILGLSQINAARAAEILLVQQKFFDNPDLTFMNSDEVLKKLFLNKNFLDCLATQMLDLYGRDMTEILGKLSPVTNLISSENLHRFISQLSTLISNKSSSEGEQERN